MVRLRVKWIPAQQNGEFEGPPIAACEEADLGVVGQMIQHKQAVLRHGVGAAKQVLLLEEALPLCLEEVVQQLGYLWVRLVAEVMHALHATLPSDRRKVCANLRSHMVFAVTHEGYCTISTHFQAQTPFANDSRQL